MGKNEKEPELDLAKIEEQETDKRAKTKKDILAGMKPAELPQEPEKKERKPRGPNKKKIVPDENTGKIFVAGLDGLFKQMGLEGLIEEQDKKYFASVSTDGDTSFAKMYAKAFAGFFEKKFKEKIDDFEVFSFYVMTMAIFAMKTNEARMKGHFEKITFLQKLKLRFGKKKKEEASPDETV